MYEALDLITITTHAGIVPKWKNLFGYNYGKLRMLYTWPPKDILKKNRLDLYLSDIHTFLYTLISKDI